MVICLNRDFELLQIEEEKTFDTFYRFLDLNNSLYNLGCPIDEEKLIKKVLVSFLSQLRENIIAMKSFHNFPSRKANVVVDKGNTIT